MNTKDPIEEFDQQTRRKKMKKVIQRQNGRVFYDYISFDWEANETWQEFLQEQQTSSKNDIERLKRVFYKKHVNSNFDVNFLIDDDTDRNEFIKQCRFYANLSSLGAIDKSNMTKLEKLFDFASRTFYLLALFIMPISIVNGYILIILAITFSATSRYRIITRNGARSFLRFWLAEEETMCLGSLFLMVFSGPTQKPLFGLTVIIWAALNVCAWGDSILQSNPEAIGLTLFQPIFSYTKLHTVKILQHKTLIEVALCLFSIPAFFMGLSVFFFPIAAFQFLRIRYAMSEYAKYAYNTIDSTIESLCPQLVYSYSFLVVKNWVTKNPNEEA